MQYANGRPAIYQQPILVKRPTSPPGAAVTTAVIGRPPKMSSTDDGCSDCWGRVPYASLIALLLSWIGVGLFCTMMYQAVNATLRQLQDIFQIRLDYEQIYIHDTSPDTIRLSFIVTGVLYALFTLALFVIGILATGSTRHRVYSGWKSRIGGRISCAIFLVLCYVCKLGWLLIFAATGFGMAAYVIVVGICPQQVISSGSQCLNFTVLAPVLQPHSSQSSNLVICGESLQKFCTLSDQALPWWVIGFVAVALIILGLTHYVICLAANYAHIKDGHKYLELAEIRYDDNEMGTYGHLNGKF